MLLHYSKAEVKNTFCPNNSVLKYKCTQGDKIEGVDSWPWQVKNEAVLIVTYFFIDICFSANTTLTIYMRV